MCCICLSHIWKLFEKRFAGTLTACAALLHYLRISIERIHLGLIRAKLNDVAVKLS